MNSDIALKKLIDGNQRYLDAIENGNDTVIKLELTNAKKGQNPYAVILSCSDSRVPAELVFNCGLGDLFVIRVAGNIVAPSQIGSIEFACQNFGTELVVVLGHTNCGAIQATVDSLLNTPETISPNIASIVDRVSPAVIPIIANNKDMDKEELVSASMRANVDLSVNRLQSRSPVLTDLVAQSKLKIVGAEYSIETGKIDFHTS